MADTFNLIYGCKPIEHQVLIVPWRNSPALMPQTFAYALVKLFACFFMLAIEAVKGLLYLALPLLQPWTAW